VCTLSNYLSSTFLAVSPVQTLIELRSIYFAHLQATRQAIKRGIRLMIPLFVLLLASAFSTSGNLLLRANQDRVTIVTLILLKEKVNLRKSHKFNRRIYGKYTLNCYYYYHLHHYHYHYYYYYYYYHHRYYYHYYYYYYYY
jgi:hypothetical protein